MTNAFLVDKAKTKRSAEFAESKSSVFDFLSRCGARADEVTVSKKIFTWAATAVLSWTKDYLKERLYVAVGAYVKVTNSALVWCSAADTIAIVGGDFNANSSDLTVMIQAHSIDRCFSWTQTAFIACGPPAPLLDPPEPEANLLAAEVSLCEVTSRASIFSIRLLGRNLSWIKHFKFSFVPDRLISRVKPDCRSIHRTEAQSENPSSGNCVEELNLSLTVDPVDADLLQDEECIVCVYGLFGGSKIRPGNQRTLIRDIPTDPPLPQLDSCKKLVDDGRFSNAVEGVIIDSALLRMTFLMRNKTARHGLQHVNDEIDGYQLLTTMQLESEQGDLQGWLQDCYRLFDSLLKGTSCETLLEYPQLIQDLIYGDGSQESLVVLRATQYFKTLQACGLRLQEDELRFYPNYRFVAPQDRINLYEARLRLLHASLCAQKERNIKGVSDAETVQYDVPTDTVAIAANTQPLLDLFEEIHKKPRDCRQSLESIYKKTNSADVVKGIIAGRQPACEVLSRLVQEAFFGGKEDLALTSSSFCVRAVARTPFVEDCLSIRTPWTLYESSTKLLKAAGMSLFALAGSAGIAAGGFFGGWVLLPAYTFTITGATIISSATFAGFLDGFSKQGGTSTDIFQNDAILIDEAACSHNLKAELQGQESPTENLSSTIIESCFPRAGFAFEKSTKGMESQARAARDFVGAILRDCEGNWQRMSTEDRTTAHDSPRRRFLELLVSVMRVSNNCSEMRYSNRYLYSNLTTVELESTLYYKVIKGRDDLGTPESPSDLYRFVMSFDPEKLWVQNTHSTYKNDKPSMNPDYAKRMKEHVDTLIYSDVGVNDYPTFLKQLRATIRLHELRIHLSSTYVVCVVGMRGHGKSTIIANVFGLPTTYGGSKDYSTKEVQSYYLPVPGNGAVKHLLILDLPGFDETTEGRASVQHCEAFQVADHIIMVNSQIRSGNKASQSLMKGILTATGGISPAMPECNHIRSWINKPLWKDPAIKFVHTENAKFARTTVCKLVILMNNADRQMPNDVLADASVQKQFAYGNAVKNANDSWLELRNQIPTKEEEPFPLTNAAIASCCLCPLRESHTLSPNVRIAIEGKRILNVDSVRNFIASMVPQDVGSVIKGLVELPPPAPTTDMSAAAAVDEDVFDTY
jgi:ABC-type cobalamin/Fe3+-siderophores transport system ATPase subunit